MGWGVQGVMWGVQGVMWVVQGVMWGVGCSAYALWQFKQQGVGWECARMCV